MQQATIHHSQQNVAVLAIVLSSILARDSESILKGEACCIETDPMAGQVPGRFVVVPLEIAIVRTTAQPYIARMSARIARSR